MKTRTQCKLGSETGYTVSWIPSEFAEVGRKLWLGKPPNRKGPYTVESVYNTVSAEEAEVQSRKHKSFREDSLEDAGKMIFYEF
jgi:hypothetical protein